MKVDKEQEFDGIIIEAETAQDDVLLCHLWCNKARVVSFERKNDGDFISIIVAPTSPDELD